jgi:hypothetical protein
LGKVLPWRICLFAGVLQTPETYFKAPDFLDAEEVSGSNPLSPTFLAGQPISISACQLEL